MSEIAEQLNAALQQKQWSITEAATKCGVNRSFLSRLLGGQPPPRSRDGRLTADQDERYFKLASTLGIETSSFIDSVERAQREEPIVSNAALQSLSDKFCKRFREQDIPPEDKREIVQIFKIVLAAGAVPQKAESLNRRILNKIPPSPLLGISSKGAEAFKRRDYLGAHHQEKMVVSKRAQLFDSIGHSLLEENDPETLMERFDVAGLFFSLATRKIENLEKVKDVLSKSR